MKSIVLDTNICIYALKGNTKVLDRLLSRPPSTVAVSVITEGELRTGAAKSGAPTKTLTRLESFLQPIQILPFTSEDARTYAKVRAKLERAGTPIGPLDMLIGAHALGRNMTLVTNDRREFSRIAGLSLENWAEG